MEWIKKNKWFLIVILILLSISTCQYRNNRIAAKKLAVSEQNIAALQDSIRLTTTKDDKPEYDKLAFLTDKVSNLEKLSQDLYKEVRNTKGKVTTIIKGGIQLVHDTTYLAAETVVDSTLITTKFKFDSTYSPGNSRLIEGLTTYDMFTKKSSARLDKDVINMSFVTGIKNLDKGSPTIFLSSTYPGFTVSSLQGAVLDPNLFKGKAPKKLSFGIQVGYSPLSYNFSSKKLGITNQITFGVGVSYRIF